MTFDGKAHRRYRAPRLEQVLQDLSAHAWVSWAFYVLTDYYGWILLLFVFLRWLVSLRPLARLVPWMVFYFLFLSIRELMRRHRPHLYEQPPVPFARATFSTLFFASLMLLLGRTELWPLFILPPLIVIIYVDDTRWAWAAGGIATIAYIVAYFLIAGKGERNWSLFFGFVFNVSLLIGFAASLSYLFRTWAYHPALKRVRQRQEAFLKAGPQLLTTDDPCDMLKVIASNIRGAFDDCTSVGIHLFHEYGIQERMLALECVAGRSWDDAKLERIEFPDEPHADKETLLCLSLRKREVICAFDVRQEPWLPNWARSLLIAPMAVATRAVGTVTVISEREHAFEEEDKSFLGTLADLGTIAYLNIERYQERGRNRERLDEIARLTPEGVRLGEKLIEKGYPSAERERRYWQEVARAARDCLEFGWVLIYLFDESREQLQLRAGFPADGLDALQPIEPELCAQLPGSGMMPHDASYLYGSGSYLLLHARERLGDKIANRFPFPDKPAEQPGRWQPDDLLLIPLRLGSGLQIGLAALGARVGWRPSKGDIRVIELFFREAMEVYEEMERKARVRSLVTASATLLAETDLLTLCQRVVHEGAALMDAEDCTLFLVTEDPTKLKMAASVCLPLSPDLISIRVGEGVGLTPYVAATKQVLRFCGEEFKSHPAWAKREDHLAYLPSKASRSQLHIPVLNPMGGIVGVLKVENRKGRTWPVGFSESDQRVFEAYANLVAVAIERARLYERSRQAILEEERSRIARELHELMNTFHMGIMIHMDLLRKELERLGMADQAQKAQILWKRSEYFLTSLRRIHEEVHDPVLLRESLLPAIQRHAEFLGLADSVITHKDGTSDRLPVKVEQALLRIAQDALDNISKHVKPAVGSQLRVQISLTIRDNKAELTIEDNGQGFDVEKALQGSTLGLISMRQWAKNLKGNLEISPLPEGGTRVKAIIPIEQH